MLERTRRSVEVPAPTDVVTLAYVAGFFDGEGCVTIATQREVYHTLRVDVAQKDTSVLYWMREAFGGSIHQKTRAHALVFNGMAAYEFLRTIQPYLRVKRVQVDLALKAFEAGDLGAIKSTLSELKRVVS